MTFIETNNFKVLAVRWSVKYSFAPNSPIFPIKLAEKRKEEHRQLQCAMRFTQTQ